MTKQQKERIRAWVEALRSGKYKQGSGRLRSEDRFCCLGVACEIYRKRTKKGRWSFDSFAISGPVSDSYILPEPVAKYFGFTDSNVTVKENPGLEFKGKINAASSFNDVFNFNFRQIADIIEGTFLK